MQKTSFSSWNFFHSFTNVIADIKLAIKLNETGYMDTPRSAKKYSCNLNPINVWTSTKCQSFYNYYHWWFTIKYLCCFLFATGKTIIQSNTCRYWKHDNQYDIVPCWKRSHGFFLSLPVKCNKKFVNDEYDWNENNRKIKKHGKTINGVKWMKNVWTERSLKY